MLSNNFFGKDLITTQDWHIEELKEVLTLAKKMKKERYSEKYSTVLKGKSFFMLFYSPSVRTRLSFECVMHELGGHAQFIEPRTMRLKTKEKPGEIPKDVANVMARYGHGIGIRITEDAVETFDEGEELIREYATHASIPVISMSHGNSHPCQGLADLITLQEIFGENLRGKKLTVSWARGTLVRSWASVSELLLITSRFGMDISLVYPEGYDLHPRIIELARRNADRNGSSFEITHDIHKGYLHADVVFSRNWMSLRRYEQTKEQEIEQAWSHKEWTCSPELMKLTSDAYFMHPMPVERGAEVDESIVDSPKSIIYQIAGNRLHIQKAVLALVMG